VIQFPRKYCTRSADYFENTYVVWASVEFLAFTEGFFVAVNRDCHQSTIVPRTDRIRRVIDPIYLLYYNSSTSVTTEISRKIAKNNVSEIANCGA